MSTGSRLQSPFVECKLWNTVSGKRELENILELIEQVRDAPEEYLGTRGISALKALLYGHASANTTETQLKFGRFSAWVAARFDWYEHTAGWCNIILKEADNDEAMALTNFFILVDEFRTAKLIPISHVDTKAIHKPSGNVTTSDEVRELPPSLTTLKYFPESRNCFLRYNYIDNPEECWNPSEKNAFDTAQTEFGIAESEWSSASS